jgi:hypothetical protein
MVTSKAPLILLRELRQVFEIDAKQLREREKEAAGGESRALGARAYAAENVVKEIDATLRDWG